MKNITAAASLAALALVTGCSDPSAYQFFDARALVVDVKTSPLFIAPLAKDPSFGVSLIGADDGGGTNPMSGQAARGAHRLYGQFARNGHGSKRPGSLSWCAARPADFDRVCMDAPAAGDTTYFTGMVSGVKVTAYGFGYPDPPRSSSDFTTDPNALAWAKG